MLRFILLLHFSEYYGGIHWQLVYKISDHLEQNCTLKSNLKFRLACFWLLPQFIAILFVFLLNIFLSRLPEILAKSQSLCSSTVFLDISHSLYYILVARNSKCILGRAANEKNWLISEKAVDSIPRLDKISHVIIFRNLRDLLGLKANNIDRPRN